jgi:hypothetical protein
MLDFGEEIYWTLHTQNDIDKYDVIPAAARKMTELLGEMAPSDLAQAVPYISIYEVNDDGSLGYKISTDLFQAPRFGESMKKQFGERPDVSLDKIDVKYHMAQGWIVFRELNLEITVHRPDAVFRADKGSLMMSLLDQTRPHVLYYGWSGGNTVLSNGLPSSIKDTQLAQTEKPDPTGPVDERLVQPIKGAVRFRVTNYNFSVDADLQIKFHIKAFEDGEIACREATIMNNRNILPLFDSTSLTLKDAGPMFDRASAYFIDQLQQYKEQMTIDVTDAKDPKKTTRQQEWFISVENIFDIFFADPLIYAARALGYSDIRLHLGLFNVNCPRTVAAFGDQEVSGQNIGSFMMPLKTITDMLAKIISSNGSITVYSLIRTITGVINSPATWATTISDSKMIPEILLRTRFNPDLKFALFQVMDRKYYVANSKINFKDGSIKNKRELRGVLKKSNVPYMSFTNKLSFIKDVKFEVVNDEMMKSIFMMRPVQKTRAEVATSNARNSQVYGGMTSFAMMYRSAIKGSVTILGNFAFDVFGLVWFDFGIPAYDGLFYVVGRNDIVTADGFYTTLTLQAEGGDPMKGGGKLASNPWTTGDGARSMTEWVKNTLAANTPDPRDPRQGRGYNAAPAGLTDASAQRGRGFNMNAGSITPPISTSKTAPKGNSQSHNEFVETLEQRYGHKLDNLGVAPVPKP